MKLRAAWLILVCALFGSAANAGGPESFLDGVRVEAHADIDGFAVRLSARFGVPEPQVRVLIREVSEPADAFMIYQLCEMSGQPPATVMQAYRSEGKQGWGALAKSLGIKPGSADFHALKRGDLSWEPSAHRGSESRGGKNKNAEKGKGKGKEKSKGKGKD